MQQRAARTIGRHRLMAAVFCEADRMPGFGNQPAAALIAEAVVKGGQGVLLLEEVRQLAGAVPEVGEVVAIAGVPHFTQQGSVFPLRRTYCQHCCILFNPPVWQVIVTFDATDAKS